MHAVSTSQIAYILHFYDKKPSTISKALQTLLENMIPRHFCEKRLDLGISADSAKGDYSAIKHILALGNGRTSYFSILP